MCLVMEPTCNAWVLPLAAGVPALRRRYGASAAGAVCGSAPLNAIHTKSDRLDSELPARLRMLHPDSLYPVQRLWPVMR
jgi:hypothetical protein